MDKTIDGILIIYVKIRLPIIIFTDVVLLVVVGDGLVSGQEVLIIGFSSQVDSGIAIHLYLHRIVSTASLHSSCFFDILILVQVRVV